jgi:hypothetical protein
VSVPGNAQTSNGASTTGAFDSAATAGSEARAPGQGSSDASSSRQESASPPETVDWIREAFRPTRVQEPAPDNQGKTEEPKTQDDTKEQDETAGASKDSQKKSGSEPPPGARLVTQQELDRLIQGEADRREAKRRDQERKQTERELREKDPYKYAQLVAQREREQEENEAGNNATANAIREQVSTYDRQVLDPLFLAVPEGDERRAIELGIGQHPDGPLVGRGDAARKLIDLIRKQGRAEGESEARRTLVNDEGFVKEVLTRRGGQRAEPEVVSPVGSGQRGAGSADDDMEGFIRGSRGRGQTR